MAQEIKAVEGDGKGEAALNRRGNAGLRKDVQEARRIYDPEMEKVWGLKYRNFSSDHMRRAYKVFAEARHDPFNKAPTWVNIVIRKVAKKFEEIGITPEEEFRLLDVSGDGTLERAEVRKMLLGVVHDLGDLELAAIFDLLDSDHSGEISLDELTLLFRTAKQAGPQGQSSPRKSLSPRKSFKKPPNESQGTDQSNQEEEEDGFHHRPPVHRVKRMAPAQIEGWEHLRQDPRYKSEADHLKERDNAMFRRIGKDLCLSPRKQEASPGSWPKYEKFGGGGDAARFDHQMWRSSLEATEAGSSASSAIAASSVPDPGGLEIRPGYHIELAKVAPHLASPSTRSSRPSRRG